MKVNQIQQDYISELEKLIQEAMPENMGGTPDLFYPENPEYDNDP